ncbi:hypothetical protein B296_00047384 [Ensete ventricosum]|uniref:Uncharacterized protein n=1 Tax=Ensete ventricosum TaxID=4639 RepID=A0A426YRQ5_ENSVE|nr:hypothetical protein B296_00047384 [Ensete ventricosum]
MVSMSLMCDNLKDGGGRPGTASASVPTLTSPLIDSCSSSEVEIPAEEAIRRAPEEGTGVPEVPNKRQAKDLVSQRKKSRISGQRRTHHEVDKPKSQVAKGKGPANPAVETPTPRQKSKSMRELCSASPGVDSRDYHAIRMCNLPELAPDAPLEIDLTLLTHETRIWLDGEALASYI